jgi:hypothetical protein
MINKRNIQIYGLIWLIPTSTDKIRNSVVGETAFLGFKNAVLAHVQLDLVVILPERELPCLGEIAVEQSIFHSVHSTLSQMINNMMTAITTPKSGIVQ